MKKERLLDKITLEELIELRKRMTAEDIAKMYGCSRGTVFNNLRGHVHGRGGKHAKRIPAHELHKGEAEEMQQMAEQNAENACVMLEKCIVKLTATVCEYTISTDDQSVNIRAGDRVLDLVDVEKGYVAGSMEIKIDKIPELIEELKGVCRCAKSFDMGNAMW